MHRHIHFCVPISGAWRVVLPSPPRPINLSLTTFLATTESSLMASTCSASIRVLLPCRNLWTASTTSYLWGVLRDVKGQSTCCEPFQLFVSVIQIHALSLWGKVASGQVFNNLSNRPVG